MSWKSSVDAQNSAGPQGQFFDALKAGTFLIQRCGTCSRCVFYPRLVCTHCGARDLSFEEPSGIATVYSTTVVRREDGNANVVLVDLDEGPRMMSTIVGIAPEAVRIGMRVRAQIEHGDNSPRIVFSPVPGEVR